MESLKKKIITKLAKKEEGSSQISLEEQDDTYYVNFNKSERHSFESEEEALEFMKDIRKKHNKLK